MSVILVDQTRRQNALKRMSDRARFEFDDIHRCADDSFTEILALIGFYPFARNKASHQAKARTNKRDLKTPVLQALPAFIMTFD